MSDGPGGIRITDVDDRWAETVWEFLRHKRAEPVFTLDALLVEHYETDPSLLPPPTGLRGWFRRVEAILGFSWREAAGRLRLREGESWKLEGVKLWEIEVGYGFGVTQALEAPWAASVERNQRRYSEFFRDLWETFPADSKRYLLGLMSLEEEIDYLKRRRDAEG